MNVGRTALVCFSVGAAVCHAAHDARAAGGGVIDVIAGDRTAPVHMAIQASREEVFVGEPFEVVLSIQIRIPNLQNRKRDALLPGQPPVLSIPYLDTRPAPGLQGPNVMHVLQQRLIQDNAAVGFAINDYVVDTSIDQGVPGPRGRSGRRLLFRLDTPGTSDLEGGFAEYRLPLVYIAEKEGRYSFGPASFSGPLMAGMDTGGKPMVRRGVAVATPCTVMVIPPPPDGRPRSYFGAVGSNMVVAVHLSTRTCRVGDPIQLTVSVSGAISLENLRPPDLSIYDQLTRAFRLYSDTVQASRVNGRKEWVYTIRPTRPGTLELPALSFAYYDIHSRRYETTGSRPIPIRAVDTPELGATSIEASSMPPEDTARHDGSATRWAAAPITMDPDGYRRRPLWRPGAHGAGLLLGPGLFLMTLGARRLRRHALGRRTEKNERSVLDRALKELRQADSLAQQTPESAQRMINHALRRYVGARLHVSEASLTPADARTLLVDNGIPSEQAHEIETILERCFNADYAGGTPTRQEPSRDAQTAGTTLRQIDAQLAGTQ